MPQPQKQKSNDNNREEQKAGEGNKKNNTHKYDFCIFTQDNLHTAIQAGDCTEIPERGKQKGKGKRKGGLSVCLFVNSMSERVSGLFCKLCVSQTAACCLVNM